MRISINRKEREIKMKRKIKSICTLVVFGVIILGILALLIAPCFNDHQYTITVTDKERVVQSSSSSEGSTINSKYLIFTETNGEVRVFENTDNILRFKFNSSDIYGMLEEGNTYKVNVIGWRVPFLSWYENILSIE